MPYFVLKCIEPSRDRDTGTDRYRYNRCRYSYRHRVSLWHRCTSRPCERPSDFGIRCSTCSGGMEVSYLGVI